MKITDLIKPDEKWHHVVITYQVVDQLKITDDSEPIPLHKTEVYIDGILEYTKIGDEGGSSVEWWQKWFEK